MCIRDRRKTARASSFILYKSFPAKVTLPFVGVSSLSLIHILHLSEDAEKKIRHEAEAYQAKDLAAAKESADKRCV